MPNILLTPLDALVASPFARLTELLKGLEPGMKPTDLSLGEPKAVIPPFLGRYPALAGHVDAERHLLPLNGSREGLFSAIFPALARKPGLAAPAVLIPNPFYQAYAAAAAASGAVPHFLASIPERGFLPDLDAIDAGLLTRTVALYLCSPSNPQGAVASSAYLAQAIALARRHDFLLFADECYSEIYGEAPPPGALETAHFGCGNFARVVAFQSLSKRSGLPGLRSGFVAGDPEFIAAFGRFRNVACPQVPLPIQNASAAAWSDETHVEQGRSLYRANFDLADAILGARYGYRRPGGAFFLWLNLAKFGGGEGAATTLWKDCGVRVLPGAYLAQAQPEGDNAGTDYVRVALVHDADTTREALTRIVATLG